MQIKAGRGRCPHLARMTGIRICNAVSELALVAMRSSLLAAAVGLVAVPAFAQSAGPLAGVTKFDMQFPSILKHGVTLKATCNVANGAVKCSGGGSGDGTATIEMHGSISGATVKVQEKIRHRISSPCDGAWLATRLTTYSFSSDGNLTYLGKCDPAYSWHCSGASMSQRSPSCPPSVAFFPIREVNGVGSWRALERTPVAAPPPQQQVTVATQTIDGKTYTIIRVEPVTALPPSGNYNQFVPAFGSWAATVGRYLEDRMFVHPDFVGPNGEQIMAVSPYITDGVINAPDASVKLARAGMEAGANWAKNNPGAIAGMAVAIMVSAAVPAAPIAAWVLGGDAAAAVGTLADVVIGGMMYSGTEASVRTMVNDFGSNKSAGQQFMNVVGSGGAAAVGSIPASIVGGNVATLLGPFVAQKTASIFGWAAGATVDKSVDALGFTNAAQTVLSGNVTSPAPQPGGTVLTAAPPSNESLSPQPGFK